MFLQTLAHIDKYDMCDYNDYNGEIMVDKIVCNDIVRDVKGLSKGTVFTLKDFYDKYKIINDVTTKFEYTKVIMKKIKNFVDVYAEDKNLKIGLPFVIRFIRL